MGVERGIRPATITEHERGTTVADKTKVRTTFTPGKVIEVGARELVDLERQHLIAALEGADGWQDDKPVETESGVITDGLVDKTDAAASKGPKTKGS